AGIAPGVEPGKSAKDAAAALATLAADLENASPAARPTARWLRGRARSLLDESGSLATEEIASFELLLSGDAPLDALIAHAERRLKLAEELAQQRRQLEAEGASAASRAETPAGRDEEELRDPWQRALERFADEQ